MENRIIRRFTKKVLRTFKFDECGTLHVHVLFEDLSTATFHCRYLSDEPIDLRKCKTAFVEPGDQITMEFQSDTLDIKVIDVIYTNQQKANEQ